MRRPFLALLLGLSVALPAAPAFEQRLTIRDAAVLLHNSTAEVLFFDFNTFSFEQRRLFPQDWAGGQQHSLRYDGSLGGQDGLRLEWNLLATLDLSDQPDSPLENPWQPEGRSAVLQRRFFERQGARLQAEVDQLALRWQSDRWNVAAGRQSVNLGEDFFFSPLDLFLPFQPQQSYRDFRPGVDAVRASFSPSRFSLVELIAVAGYESFSKARNTIDHRLLLDGPRGKGSLLARAQAGGESWSLTLLGGRARQESVGGGAVQLEWLGASWTLEGLQGTDLALPLGHTDGTLGVTRQWNSLLSSRLEANLSEQRQDYSYSSRSQRRLQAGASLSLQATPLLSLAPAVFWYATDQAGLASLVATYSLSDNGVLELGLNAPLLTPGPPGPYGSSLLIYAPTALSLELRTVL